MALMNKNKSTQINTKDGKSRSNCWHETIAYSKIIWKNELEYLGFVKTNCKMKFVW